MACQFRTRRQIEFADTDMAGIVHFSRFFVFMEAAEHEFLRSLGLSVHLERDGHIIGWPRLATACEYLHPVRFEEELDIQLQVARVGTKSVTYEFDFSRDGMGIARGKLTVACCHCDPGAPIRAIPIPDFIRAKVEEMPAANA